MSYEGDANAPRTQVIHVSAIHSNSRNLTTERKILDSHARSLDILVALRHQIGPNAVH